MCNRGRFNFAHATYNGRFDKTIDIRLVQFKWISMIGLFGDGNLFYVSPAHAEILNYQ